VTNPIPQTNWFWVGKKIQGGKKKGGGGWVNNVMNQLASSKKCQKEPEPHSPNTRRDKKESRTRKKLGYRISSRTKNDQTPTGTQRKPVHLCVTCGRAKKANTGEKDRESLSSLSYGKKGGPETRRPGRREMEAGEGKGECRARLCGDFVVKKCSAS